MSFKKLTAMLLCLVLCTALLAGCGAAPAEDDTNTLVVATHATFPPYEYYEDGQPVGIDLDIMQAVCDHLGYKMEVVDMEFGSIIPAVASGKADVGAAAITVTEERAESVHFTTSYATGIQAVIVQEGSPITTLEDLRGEDVVIGVQQDTTGDLYATDDFGEEHIARFNKGADAVQALVTGKCQAVIIDDGPAAAYIALNEGLALLPTAYTEEDYAFEISYDNEELYQAVNGALEELLANGTIQQIIDQYISAD